MTMRAEEFKTRVRVTASQTRDVKIFERVFDRETREHAKTGNVLRTDKITRVDVVFSGSERAFKIWRAVHALPVGASVERTITRR